MKKISVVIPCFNEQENISPISKEVAATICKQLPSYDYEIIFIDNKSKDNTRNEILKVCKENEKIKAIFNVKNFGQFNSPFYGICQAGGDCAIMLCCDFQDPISLIPTFVKEWEQGANVVCAIKTTSKENGFMYFLRSVYYKTIKKMSDVPQIEHFTGFGLYDRSFIEIAKSLHDPMPFFRGIVAEYAPDFVAIEYQQQKRRAGITKNNIFSLYDAAMLSFTSYTKAGLRIATFTGMIISLFSFLIAIGFLVMKLIYWDRFVAGLAPIAILVAFLGGAQLAFIGILSEYIMNINLRIINRPLVIEEKRINF